MRVLLELKKAHARDLEAGLLEQLPTYLDERAIKLGIYGLLWFKGVHWAEPKDENLDQCIGRLKLMMPERVKDVVGFDLAYKTSASKKRRAKKRTRKRSKSSGRRRS